MEIKVREVKKNKLGGYTLSEKIETVPDPVDPEQEIKDKLDTIYNILTKVADKLSIQK